MCFLIFILDSNPLSGKSDQTVFSEMNYQAQYTRYWLTKDVTGISASHSLVQGFDRDKATFNLLKERMMQAGFSNYINDKI